MRLALVLVLALVTEAAAQPAPCRACSRGDTLIEHFALQPLRVIAGDLAAMPLGDPVTVDQFTRIVEMRRQTPALARLGAVGDADLAAIAASLCHAATGTCVDATTRTLRCLADRCTVDLPPDPRNVDVPVTPSDCHATGARERSSALGLGLDSGVMGLQRSRYPSDGSTDSIGIEARLRLGSRLGAVARVDHMVGREALVDLDHDGKDDVSTGDITRVSVLAGPSFILDYTRLYDTTRFVQLDLLGGYLATRTQPNEDGPAAGFDLTYQLWTIRLGARLVQGFGAAHDATLVIAHFGFLVGGAPHHVDASGCTVKPPERRSRLALGMDITVGGYGFADDLGYLETGVAFEGFWHLTHTFDAMARLDTILYPGGDREQTTHQALLAGLRIDHSHEHQNTGFFSTVLGGYTQGAGLTPTTAGSGPIVEVGFGWGFQAAEGAASVRLHGRFGVSHENIDYRAVFASLAFELRLDRHSWSDRD